MNEIMNYDKAVEIIKTAILQSQYDAARSVNEKVPPGRGYILICGA